MSLAAGVTRLTSVETDRAFRDRLAAEPDIAVSLASGRLALVHADIGPTENWGYPLAPPGQMQMLSFLGWAARSRGIDLAFIDGRFRVAVAAAISLASPRATILIHDYASRPHYHEIEEFLDKVEEVGDLAAFRSRRAPFRALRALLRHWGDAE
jgi:hypothetical protein